MTNNITYQKRMDSNLCVRCAKSLLESKRVYCESCLEHNRKQQNELHRNRRDKGLCSCGAPKREKGTTCEECVNKHHKRLYETSRQKISQGLCKRCSRGYKSLPSSLFCERCYLRILAKKYLDNASAWTDLQNKLVSQRFLCPYTKEIIELGRNSSIDHILPISRYPDLKYNIDNLEWVSLQVNKAKHDLTKDEFMDMVSTIYLRKDL